MTRLDSVSEFSAVLPDARGRQLSRGGRDLPPAERRALTSIVVLGQTPPPYHGQAMMINRLVRARFERIRVHHVRMAFSSSMQEVGAFAFVKVLRLASTICRALVARFRWRAALLYYPPAGPNTIPVLRDIILLLALRPFFRRTVFHFRAAGVSEFIASRPWPFRWAARLAYYKPDGAIQLSELNPADAEYVGARRVAIIPNGLEDEARGLQRRQRAPDEPVRILCVGLISEQKGALVLLRAARLLAADGRNFRLTFVGAFGSKAVEGALREFCEENALAPLVDFVGTKVEKEKWAYFRDADILCFPTFFEAESFGNVAVEGMMFQLPVVATRWRGIPSIVLDGVTGLLVPPKDVDALAASLGELIQNPNLRTEFGQRGRRRYLEEFTLERHLARMEEFLVDVALA